MPTTMTQAVHDGEIDTKVFLQLVSRRFGAYAALRDCDQGEIPPRHVEASTYHFDEAVEAKERLAMLQTLSPDAVENAAHVAHQTEVARITNRQAEQAAVVARITGLLEKVKAWEATSESGKIVKEHGIEILERDLDWEGIGNDDSPIPEELSPQRWLAREIQQAATDMSMSLQAFDEECERTVIRNQWLDELYADLDRLS